MTDRAAEGGSRQMMGKMINSLNFKKLNGKDKVMKAFFDVAVATTTTTGVQQRLHFEMSHSRTLFCLFSSFSHCNSNIN